LTALLQAVKTMMRYRLLAIALLMFGRSTSSRPFNSPEALANLKSQAAEVGQAMLKEDHQRMANLTHPVLVDHFGGRSGYIKKLEEIAEDLRRQGLTFHAFELGTPSQMIELSGELYAIYPYRLELSGPNGEPASKPAYLICTSADKGTNWKFLHGAGVGADRAKLKQILPRFPDELPLPEP
jgi:hypothetical protein